MSLLPRTATLAALATFAGTLALVGCGSDPGREVGIGTTATTQDPIINGTASGPEDDAAVWVGSLSSSGYPTGMCSGVLVADNIILTARHCVSRTEDGGIACSKDGKPISGGDVLSDHTASSMAILLGSKMKLTADARGKVVLNTGATNLCNNDIAIIILDRRIPDAPIAPIRLESAPVKGETIRAVGWGVSNTSGRGRKRRTGIPITAVGPSFAMGAVAPNEFAIGEGICQGDSGGPAFAESTGAVIGVVSRGGNGAPYDPSTDPAYTQCIDSDVYKTHNIYTRTDSFKDLILKAFADAGSEPWIEGHPDPRKAKLGELCTGPDSCRSGICIDVSGKNICSDRCDEAACPAGYDCVQVGDSKLCAPGAPPPSDPGAPPAPSTPATGTKGSSCSVSDRGSEASAPFAFFALIAATTMITRRRR